MVSRAIVVNYKNGNDVGGGQALFDPNGNPILYVTTLYVDTANAAKSASLGAIIVLDATNPAGWNAAIKAQLTQIGVDCGFLDLVTTAVFIPTYA